MGEKLISESDINTSDIKNRLEQLAQSWEELKQMADNRYSILTIFSITMFWTGHYSSWNNSALSLIGTVLKEGTHSYLSLRKVILSYKGISFKTCLHTSEPPFCLLTCI